MEIANDIPVLNIDTYKKELENIEKNKNKAEVTNNSKSRDEFDKLDFLKLLTTQLKYQNPLDPVSNDQFLSQMTQLTSTQTLLDMKKSLETISQSFEDTNNALKESSESISNASYINLIDKNVKVLSNKLVVDNVDDGVDINFAAPVNLNNIKLVIYDEFGEEVKSIELAGTNSTGEINTYHWDGTDKNGKKIAEGTYEIKFFQGDKEIENAGIPIEGTVEAVRFNGTNVNVVVNNEEYSAVKVLEINK